jgi:hypothetical protein
MNRLGPLLPFDSLILPTLPFQRLLIAYGASSTFLASKNSVLFKVGLHNRVNDEEYLDLKNKSILHIGFMSYDFNDHPTAHLVEGIFDVMKRLRNHTEETNIYESIHLTILSMGKDDNSTYRIRLEEVNIINTYFLIQLYIVCNCKAS